MACNVFQSSVALMLNNLYTSENGHAMEGRLRHDMYQHMCSVSGNFAPFVTWH